MELYFACVSAAGEIAIWEAFSCKLIWQRTIPSNNPTGLRIFPDNKYVFVSTRDGVYVVNFVGGCKKMLANETYNCLDISDDGKYLLLGTDYGRIDLWRLPGVNYKNRSKVFSVNQGGSVTTVKFEKFSQNILTGGTDQLVYRWNRLGQELQCYEGHNSEITGIATTDGPRGVITCAGANDGTAKLWQLDDGIVTYSTSASATGPVNSAALGLSAVAVDPRTATLYTAGRDGVINCWDMVNNKLIGRLIGTYNLITQIWLDPSGRYLLTSGSNAVIFLWDLQDKVIIAAMAMKASIVGMDVFSIVPEAKLNAKIRQNK